MTKEEMIELLFELHSEFLDKAEEKLKDEDPRDIIASTIHLFIDALAQCICAVENIQSSGRLRSKVKDNLDILIDRYKYAEEKEQNGNI